MRLQYKLLALAVSILAAYLALVYTSIAASGIIVGIPLLIFRPSRAFISALLIGLFSSFSLYLLYPLSEISKIASILAGIAGIPSVLTILLYPLLFSFLAAFSAALSSELLSSLRKRTISSEKRA